MKKFYLLTLIVCSFFCTINFSMAQCDLPLIRSTFTGAGCTELAGCTSSCSIYFFNPITQTGDQAQAWAQNYGANLISLQSAAENACIVSELNAHAFGGVIWIGFNDIASEGTFVWYDQSPVVYTNWNGGEPNNSGNEDCVQIYPDGHWNDLNCSSGGSHSVIEVNLCPVTTITPSITTICAGQNATLTASTILGSFPYTYSWTSVPAGFTSTSTAPTVNPSVTTTYYVTATDRYGCTSTTNILITVNSLPTATIAGSVTVCKDAAAPGITFTGASGTAPYTFAYTVNGGALQTISTSGGSSVVILNAPTTTVGTFIYSLAGVQESSSTACSQIQSGTATVTVNPLPTATISGDMEVCQNDAFNLPDITFTGAGGAVPYTFNYNINGGPNQTISTSGGSSIVTLSAPTNIAGTFMYDLASVSDNNNCLHLQAGMVMIKVNPLPTATISGTVALCVGASAPNITFTGAAGTAPYTFTYTLNGGANQTVITTSGNSVNIPVPTSVAGTFIYTLEKVQDASSTSCFQSQTGSATVTVNPLPTATIAGTAAVCKGGQAPNIIFTGAAGTLPYTFTYTINGGTNLTLSTTGGNSFVNVLAPTTSAGTFIYALVSVKDASTTACSQLQNGTATVIVNPLPTAAIGGTTTVCKNDPAPNITFTGAAGVAPYTITYTINSGANLTVTTIGNTANVPAPTGTSGVFTYSQVSIIDASSTACSQIQSGGVTVIVNPLPLATVAGTTTVCKNSSSPNILFTGTAGTAPYTITYKINGGSNQTVVTNNGGSATVIVPTSTAGTFIYDLVSVADASTTVCSQLQSGSATVTVNPLPSATIAGTTSVCKNGPAPNITFTGSVGTPPYTFIYKINGGVNHTVSTINGNSVTVPASTGTVGIYTYALVSVNEGSSIFCSQVQSGTATVTVNPLPIASVTGTTAVCKNDTAPNISFTGSAGTLPYTFTYSINGGANQTISSASGDSVVLLPAPTTVAGTFNYALVSVQDASSTTCSQSQSGSAIVTVNPLPTATINGSTSVCKDDSPPGITFSGAGSIAPYTFTYSINGGANQTISTISGNSVTTNAPTGNAGTFIYSLVSVQDANSTACSQTQSGSVTVTVNPKPVVLFNASKTDGCEPLCINFQDSSSIVTGNNAIWSWNFGDGNNGSQSNHCYTNGTVFNPLYLNITLTVTSDSGCVNSSTKNNYITVYPKPTASFRAMPDSATIMDPVFSMINLSAGANFWNWNFGDQDTSSGLNPAPHSYADTGRYTITLIAATQYGCEDTTYQNVFIQPDFSFFVPSAFSPNDDGVNDTFSGKGIFITKYQMMIFDRWGNLIFFTEDIHKPWDGKANLGTQIAQPDVYLYMIKLTDINRKKHEYKGIVTLVR